MQQDELRVLFGTGFGFGLGLGLGFGRTYTYKIIKHWSFVGDSSGGGLC